MMVPADSKAAASGPLTERVRSSCAALVAHEGSAVRVNADKVRAFTDALNWSEFESLAKPDRFPLNFRSRQDEINFLVLHGLLNFGSGFRKDLHKLTDRGAYETILYGLIGMYISAPKLDGKFMSALTIDAVANYFSLPLERDEELSPGIYISKPGPLKPLAEMLRKVLNESGEQLVAHGAEDFGAFVLSNVSTAPSPSDASAVQLLDAFVSTFSAFSDHCDVEGVGRVYFLKRAQLAIASVHRRFKDDEQPLAFVDIDQLTVFTDNVLPCVLRAMGILEYTPELDEKIARGEELPSGKHESEIRAGAIVACEQIVRASNGRLSTLELDWYLWRVGKEPRFRGIERHATRDTFYY